MRTKVLHWDFYSLNLTIVITKYKLSNFALFISPFFCKKHLRINTTYHKKFIKNLNKFAWLYFFYTFVLSL